MSKIINLSDIVEATVWIRGEKINLDDYPLFRAFYNSIARRCMIKSGRQIGKSTGIAAKQTTKASFLPNKRILTVLPLASQSQRFSKLYVDPIIRYSPLLKQRVDKNLQFCVSTKMLNNGSELHFNYAGDDPDRVRGISVQEICWDEIQDINIEHIPVVEQCASQERNSKFQYCGTPKTRSNTIETLWLKSSQSEPYITCSRCRYDNYCTLPDVYNMIKPEGLCCQKCQRLLDIDDVKKARYTHLNPAKVGEFDGFHIPQIYIPYNLHPKRWKKTYQDFEEYSPFMFATEVLGISYDLGGNPITMEHLLGCCDNERSMKNRVDFNKYSCIVAGIDWGISAKASWTVLTILGVRKNNGKIDMLYTKKFPYTDPEEQVKEIMSMCKQYNCTAIGSDFGVGYAQNMRIRYTLGFDKMYEYQYSNGNKVLTYLREQSRYLINKVQTLDLTFADLRNKLISFPKAEESMPYFNDLMSITEELKPSPGGEKRYYVKNPGIPDDFTHALNFALTTVRLLTKGSVISNILEE